MIWAAASGEAGHGLTAARRESPVDWEVGEADSVKVCPEYLWVERLGSLLVSSLSFEEMGFPSLPVSDLEQALSVVSPFEPVRSDVGRDHSGAESEMAPVWNPL